MKPEYLKLYSANIPVKGKKISAIYALDRGEIYLIANTLFELLQEMTRTPFASIKKAYASQSDVFDSYISFLKRENLAFFTQTPECFPKLSLQYHTPEIISSAIAEYAFGYNLESLVTELNNCNCKYLQIQFNCDFSSFGDLKHLIESTEGSTLRRIEIVINYNKQFKEEQLKELIRQNKKIGLITICNSPKQEIKYEDSVTMLFFTCPMPEYVNESILKNVLLINYRFFMESQKRNPYYNKKVFIAANGDIRNDQFKPKTFGNVNKHKLSQIVNQSIFQLLWKSVPKQLIDSEFKYCLYNPSGKVDISNFKNCTVFRNEDIH
jgi:hypothetical protein